MNRLSFLKKGIMGSLAAAYLPNVSNAAENIVAYEAYDINKVLSATTHTLPALGYAFDALEPHIDKATMEIHHDRHHKAYVDNLNKAIVGTAYENMPLADMFKNTAKLPAIIRNNGGGHWNHTFFWQCLAASTSLPAESALAQAINKKWGSMEAFKDEFAKAATGRFGSGWAWLVVQKDKSLAIGSTPNQDNPLMGKAVDIKGAPVLSLDVWEHAYYLKYQNKRADYVKAFWNVVNWPQVEKWYAAAIK